MDTDLFTCINQNVVSMWEAKGECERRQEEGALKAVSLMMKWTEFRKLKVRELNSLSSAQRGTNEHIPRAEPNCWAQVHSSTHTDTKTQLGTSLSVVTCWDRHTHKTHAHTHIFGVRIWCCFAISSLSGRLFQPQMNRQSKLKGQKESELQK